MCPTNVFNFVAFLVACFVFNTNADLGDSCQTPNGETAKCISIYDCQLLLNVVTTKDDTQKRFLKESQCIPKTPLVCCGSSTNYTPKLSALPDRKTCGFQQTNKVLGGEDADMGEFPWMALIQYQKRNAQKQFACGGSLISARYVLTAAHCLIGDVLTEVGDPVMVRLGEWNTDTDEDCIKLGNLDICIPRPVDFGIERKIVHESYGTGNKNNDIALIRLAGDVSFSNYIMPICLPMPSESSRVGEKLYIAGWGATLTGKRSAIKQKLLVPIVDKSTCSRTFSSARIRLSDFSTIPITLNDNQICAGGERNKDSCRGDSGGPLMRTSRSEPSQWYVEGIVSFGVRCGSEGWPGIYTKVLPYMPWIEKNVY